MNSVTPIDPENTNSYFATNMDSNTAYNEVEVAQLLGLRPYT